MGGFRIREGLSSNPMVRHQVGTFYRMIGENKFFKQRGMDVLMVNQNKGGLITSLKINFIAEMEDDWGDKFEQISQDIFEYVLKDTMRELCIYKYSKNE